MADEAPEFSHSKFCLDGYPAPCICGADEQRQKLAELAAAVSAAEQQADVLEKRVAELVVLVPAPVWLSEGEAVVFDDVLGKDATFDRVRYSGYALENLQKLLRRLRPPHEVIEAVLRELDPDGNNTRGEFRGAEYEDLKAALEAVLLPKET